MRDREIHRLYHEIMDELGNLANAVSKNYVYEQIQKKTKLSIRTISFIQNGLNSVKYRGLYVQYIAHLNKSYYLCNVIKNET